MGDYISRNKVIKAINNTTWWKCHNGNMEMGAQSSEYAWFKAQDVYAAIENIPGETYPQETWLSRAQKLLPEMDADRIVERICPVDLFGDAAEPADSPGSCPVYSGSDCRVCWGQEAMGDA